jgi:hypothetical protein
MLVFLYFAGNKYSYYLAGNKYSYVLCLLPRVLNAHFISHYSNNYSKRAY